MTLSFKESVSSWLQNTSGYADIHGGPKSSLHSQLLAVENHRVCVRQMERPKHQEIFDGHIQQMIYPTSSMFTDIRTAINKCRAPESTLAEGSLQISIQLSLSKPQKTRRKAKPPLPSSGDLSGGAALRALSRSRACYIPKLDLHDFREIMTNVSICEQIASSYRAAVLIVKNLSYFTPIVYWTSVGILKSNCASLKVSECIGRHDARENGGLYASMSCEGEWKM
ncbi:hypothetical protein AJ78_01823 [Emergomyces pasteurianus Ep9510]|uniref:Uncharacterized protein n=1 Tax=Emergomyces pasteurianus Ep9510 TaxID=1447872 RepID=A0A1J9QSC7_9EURO|nr:hypothetical protein AJ78_01823 [Emergomyces pasteurianus Ep9510]